VARCASNEFRLEAFDRRLRDRAVFKMKTEAAARSRRRRTIVRRGERRNDNEGIRLKTARSHMPR
jgi:hypothetical protein